MLRFDDPKLWQSHDHKFPVIKFVISSERKQKKITSLHNFAKWNKYSEYVTSKTISTQIVAEMCKIFA